VHGREAYRRNSYLVCYMFFKNVLLVMPQFWYGISSVFSGQTFYEMWLYQSFNLLFTSVPIVWFALFDYEKTKEELISKPGQYYLGVG